MVNSSFIRNHAADGANALVEIDRLRRNCLNAHQLLIFGAQTNGCMTFDNLSVGFRFIEVSLRLRMSAGLS